MKPYRGLFLLFSFIVCLSLETLYAQKTPDFRNVRWGLSPKQVKEAETAKPVITKREKLLYSSVTLADRTVGLEYEFNGDSLLSASYYYYMRASITKDDVIAASVDFEALLKEKYGPGKTSFAGDIRNVVWLTPRTQISLSVGNVDRGWSVEIQYLCRTCTVDQPKNDAAFKGEFKPLKEVKDF